MAAIPPTRSMFVIPDPMRFPIKMLLSPFFAEVIVTKSSGSDVPIAIAVIPIIVGDIVKKSAMSIADVTKYFAPKKIAVSPMVQ